MQSPASLRRLLRRSPKEAAIQSDSSTVVKAAAVDDKARPLPLKKLLEPRVIIPAANYAFLAIVDITLRAIQPVFYSTPIELGGLGLVPQQIGSILAVYGVVNGLTQIFFFSRVNDRFGSKRVYLAGIVSIIPVFAMFPFINEVARLEGRMVPLVWGLVFGQALLSIIINFSYGPCFLFVFVVPLRLTLFPLTLNLCFSRRRLHFYHRLGAEQGLARRGKRHRADARLAHAHHRAGNCQLALLALDRPGTPLHGRVLRVLRHVGHRARRVLGGHAPARRLEL